MPLLTCVVSLLFFFFALFCSSFSFSRSPCFGLPSAVSDGGEVFEEVEVEVGVESRCGLGSYLHTYLPR